MPQLSRDPAADDGARRERDLRGDVRRRDRRDREVREPAQAGRLPRARPARPPVGNEPRDPRADLKAGLVGGPPRARRGRLVGRSPAGPDPRLLPASPLAARAPGRDHRRGAQARGPVLVPLDAGGGLRLRAAVLDGQEAPPARDPRRLKGAQGHLHRDLRHPPEDARGGKGAGVAGRGRLPTERPRLARSADEEGRRRDTGARILWPVKRASSAAGNGPKSCALARRLPAPTGTVAKRKESVQRGVDFHASSKALLRDETEDPAHSRRAATASISTSCPGQPRTVIPSRVPGGPRFPKTSSTSPHTVARSASSLVAT